MTKRICRWMLLACVPAALPAMDGSCQPVFDALAKLAKVPVHIYNSETAAYLPAPRSNESIYVGGAVYVRVRDKWRRSPIGADEIRQGQREGRKQGVSA